MTALDGWGCALLADPVGSGKTWIALAVAAARHQRIAVIAPALLRQQWLSTARRLSLQIQFTSLEQVSRGTLPPASTRIVLIDEAHRLRRGTTRRVFHLAPWLPGRETLLITGTPVMRSPRNLIDVLRLGVADDALRLDGVQSLTSSAAVGIPPVALRRLVVREQQPLSAISVQRRTLPVGRREADRGRALLTRLDRLRLGETPTVARLIRTVLLDAASSSDAAWRDALRRYRDLLLSAQEAGALDRHAIRRFAGAHADQTVMWQLLTDTSLATVLPLQDREVIDQILAEAPRDDCWLDDLVAVARDDIVTLWFSRHLATARLLRARLGQEAAWVTGEAAGIGATRLARSQVLSAFGPERDQWHLLVHPPRHLVLTDLAAEGLDLQGAGRVIHVDLPWYHMAMRQRLGRIVRTGQWRADVIELVRQPAPALARALNIPRRLARTRRPVEQWMTSLTGPPPEALADGGLERGRATGRVVVICRDGPRHGMLRFRRSAGRWRPLPPVCDGEWPLGPADRLAASSEPPPRALVEAVATLTRPATVSRPRLLQHLNAQAAVAMRRHQSDRIRQLDLAWRGALRSHQLGLERQLDQLAVESLIHAPATLSRNAPVIAAWYHHLGPAPPRD